MIKKTAADLGEFYDAIREIGDIQRDKSALKNDTIPRLWFRGHGFNHYRLIPSLYRGKYYKQNAGKSYSQINLSESYRYQHMKSRVYHYVKTNPKLECEWQEIYQHHLGNTRFMDWTESAKTALSFALEPLIDSQFDNRNQDSKRKRLTPEVWILNPCLLNERIYEFLSDSKQKGLVEALLEAIGLSSGAGDIQDMMRCEKETFFAMAEGDIEISRIVSLSVLEDYRENAGGSMRERVQKGEFNPFHYLVLRLYSDAVPYEISDTVANSIMSDEPDKRLEILPPMAVLQPYHSERIKTQRGTFTIFPNYVLGARAESMAKRRNVDLREMQRQELVKNCLAKISILHPNRVAEQLLMSGERRTELYPDMDAYVELIETQRYYY